MANPEHLEILRKGVDVWNEWRDKNPRLIPDLSYADMNGAKLRGANLNGANLYHAYLKGADLTFANLSGADLSVTDLFKANLSGAKLIEAKLNGADLSDADLSGGKLIGADLTFANLGNADLSVADLFEANLSGTNLSGAKLDDADLGHAVLIGANLISADLRVANLIGVDLNGADLSKTTFLRTVIDSTDLSEVKGLDTIKHEGRSTIGVETLYRSKGNIPEVFLRGVGFPENFIQYIGSLVGKAFDYYSCFISYSSKDQEFTERLHADLQAKGVRNWFAPEDLKIGDKLDETIDREIRVNDKLMVILSENSINSAWVQREVKRAIEKEQQSDHTVLFPIRLDNVVLDNTEQWANDIRRTRHIGDFTHWKDHDAYQKAFDRLIRDLKAA